MAKKIAKRVAAVEPRPEPTVIERIKYNREYIEYELGCEMRRCNKIRTEWLAGVNKENSDLCYAILHSEDLIMSELAREQLLLLEKFYRKNIDEFGKGVEFVLKTITDERERRLNEVIEYPYRHNSTCAMSNFHQECEVRAKASFWQKTGFSRGFATRIIHYLEEWLAAESEMLSWYD